MALVVCILVVFVIAAVTPSAYRRWPRAAYAFVIGVAVVACAGFASSIPAIARAEVITYSFVWVPALGVTAAFRLDGLALLFALAITGVGALVLAYAAPYERWGRDAGRLLGLLLAFLGSMLGLVLADDAITMFVFWELTSFTSFFLIAFEDKAEARAKARQALIVTSAGGLVLLVGLIVLARAAAPDAGVSVTLSALAAIDVRAHPLYGAIVILIAIGAFTKSAQFPFHFWLPGAMVAPTPVSAYLHSATMVKAGIYLLARFHPSLGGTALWTGLLATVGAITFVIGAVLATVQRDLKLALAYATISVLGALTLLLGIGSASAIEAAIVLLVAHLSYKAALFLVAGNLGHQRGTRDPFATGGAARELPVTAAAAAIASASMAGLPPLLGFIAKDALIAANLESAWSATTLTVLSIVAASALVSVAWLTAHAPFWRRPCAQRATHEASRGMLVGPLVLAALGLVAGMIPGLLEPIAAPATAAIAGRSVPVDIELWPGIAGVHGAAFGLGAASFVIGTLGYIAVARYRDRIARIRSRLDRIAAARAYDLVMSALEHGACWLTERVQHGQLHGYIIVVVLATLVVVGAPIVAGGVPGSSTIQLGVYELPIVLLAVAGVYAATVLRNRFAAIAALATTGLAVSILFALFSGPDLAITQLTVESIMIILLVLVVRRLPRIGSHRRARHRLSHAVIGAAAGALVCALLLLATSTAGFEPQAADAHIRLAAEDRTENVVNAVLVNFRAIDTLGEITVLAIAGIGVMSLLRSGRK